MTTKNNTEAFYVVVQFLELPFEGVDDYVCVPRTWIIVRHGKDQKAFVMYPKEEDPHDTRHRVKKKQGYDSQWRNYMATIKYESDDYSEAECWIATRNYYRSLAEEESNITGTQPWFTLNNQVCSTNQSYSSKFNHPRKPLPKICIKRPALLEPNKLDGKRLKPGVAQSYITVVNDANALPGCSKSPQLEEDFQENQLGCAHIEETATTSNGDEGSEQRTQILRTEEPEVSHATKERLPEVIARASSTKENQHGNNAASFIAMLINKAAKSNLWRFVLPREYDPHDPRWTLKYPTSLPGLVELVSQSDIYINNGELQYCNIVSKDCKSLARQLLLRVFNKKALSVCLSMSEKAQASDNVAPNIRPALDERASMALLNYVLDHGLQCGWNIDPQPIITTLDNEILEIRFNYGLMHKSEQL